MLRRALAFLAILPLCALCSCRACGEPEPDPAAVASNNRGVALMGRFDFEGARAVFEGLAKRFPGNVDLRLNLAVATLNRQADGDGALVRGMLEEIVADHPRNPRALYLHGLLELYEDRPGEALARFREVLALDPGDPDAWYFAGKCLLQLSRHGEALEALEQARRRDPLLLSALYASITALRQLGRSGDAAALIEEYQGLKDDPRGRQLEFKYLRMGRRAEAVAIDAGRPASSAPPAGPVFAAARPLPLAGPAPAWAGAPDPSAPPGITAADLDGDGSVDLFLTGAVSTPRGPGTLVLWAVPGDGTYRPDPGHPLSGLAGVTAALWGDVDNDGLVDLYLCRTGRNQLWRQRPRGRWQDVAAEAGVDGGDRATVDGALLDADHDGDLDVFVVNADGPNELFNNDRDGSFRPLAGTQGLLGDGRPSRSVLATDLDGDRDADLLVFHDRPPHEVYLNDRTWRYHEPAGYEELLAAEVAAAVAADRDGDGGVEVYTASASGAIDRWSRGEGGKWSGRRIDAPAGLPESPALPSTRVALADADGDGALDLFVSTPDGWRVVAPGADGATELHRAGGAGSPEPAAWALVASTDGPRLVVWDSTQGLREWPPGPGRHRFAVLSVSGLEDRELSMRSNASGIGTRIAARVGSRWTIVDTFRASSGPGQSLQPVAVGLGGADRIDFVALDWSDGVYQTEIDLEAGRLHRIAETQRQLSSCPVLFAWDGSGFGFITDLLGVGGIGYAVGPGQYAEPRPRESLVLPAGSLAPRDGRYAVKLTEPMEEVMYLDALRLVLHDLPPGWSMTLDERMGISGPEPSGRPVFFRRSVLPSRAVNDRGEDVTWALLHADRQAADPGLLDKRFIGRLDGEHVLTLEFSEPLDGGPGGAVLVLDGWVEYPYSQTGFAAWQAGAEYRAPSLDARGADGEWRPLLEQFGYPAGMPRQMTVPLPALPRGARELRIRTNLEVYWDRVAVAYAEPCPECARQVLPLASARLEQVGFPERANGPQRLPSYDFARRRPLWDTRAPEGFYTRLGPVEDLVASADGALVIFGPGEGVHVEFTAPAAQPAGWSRVPVVEAEGWCKDMDLYTRDGDTVEPVPRVAGQGTHADRLLRRHTMRFLAGRQ